MSITISGTGAITGVSTNYSFDKSVSIAGTVTYEDVTNVDSVGIITAQSGVHFGTAASGTLVRGDSTGIGIGTTNPGAAVHLATAGASTLLQLERTGAPAKIISSFGGGDSSFKYTVNDASSFKLGIDDSDSDRFKLSFGSADNAEFGTNDYFTVSTAGDVGIGLANPGTKLAVSDTAAASGISSTSLQLLRSNYGAQIDGWIDQGVNHGWKIATVDSGTPTEQLRIRNDGYVFFGGNGYLNTFPGSGNTNKGLMFEKTSSGYSVFMSRDNNTVLYVNRNGNGDIISCRRSGNDVGAVRVDASNTFFDTSSDYRLKENIIGLTSAISRVKQLEPKRFNFIRTPGVTIDGFLAHEVDAVVPHAVYGEYNGVDGDGNPVYQKLDTGKLIPLLTAALKESISEIESLKARVDALEGN